MKSLLPKGIKFLYVFLYAVSQFQAETKPGIHSTGRQKHLIQM